MTAKSRASLSRPRSSSSVTVASQLSVAKLSISELLTQVRTALQRAFKSNSSLMESLSRSKHALSIEIGGSRCTLGWPHSFDRLEMKLDELVLPARLVDESDTSRSLVWRMCRAHGLRPSDKPETSRFKARRKR